MNFLPTFGVSSSAIAVEEERSSTHVNTSLWKRSLFSSRAQRIGHFVVLRPREAEFVLIFYRQRVLGPSEEAVLGEAKDDPVAIPRERILAKEGGRRGVHHPRHVRCFLSRFFCDAIGEETISHNDGKSSEQQAEQEEEKEEVVTVEVGKEEGVPSYSVKRKGCFWESGGRARVRVARMRELYTHEHARRRASACVVRMRERER